MPPGPTLYVFVDESGNFDFSDRGTTHFVLGAIATTDPAASASHLQRLRYHLLDEGYDVSSFHATEDKQVIRNEVFAAMAKVENVRIHVIHGDKHRAAPSKQSDEALYTLFGRALIRYFLRVYEDLGIGRIVVVFDRTLTGKKRGAFQQAIKPVLKESGHRFSIYFQPMDTDFNGQMADYASWAKFVSLERAEHRPWTALRPLRPSDFDIFRYGHTKYY
jgi:hypothetical protein